MTREEKIEILEKEKAYMIAHGGDRQAEALTSAIKALSQEPLEVEAARSQKAYNKGFEDCRQAVLASIKNLYPDMPIVDIFGARQKWLEKYAPYFECENAVEKLPPVNPQEPKTGHWIYFKAVNTSEIVWSECSVCGNGESGCAKRMKYCPECGARMIEPQEGSDKE